MSIEKSEKVIRELFGQHGGSLSMLVKDVGELKKLVAKVKTWLILFLLSIVVSAIGFGIAWGSIKTKVDSVSAEQITINKTEIIRVKEDVSEMKSDIKEILRAVTNSKQEVRDEVGRVLKKDYQFNIVTPYENN